MPTPSPAAETLTLMAALGVAPGRFIDGGPLAVRSPVDGGEIGRVAATAAATSPGARRLRRSAASSCGCSARSCAAPRRSSAGW